MKLRAVLISFALLQQAIGHTLFTTLFIDDVNQGDGTCVRMPMAPKSATFPVNDLASSDMACGFGGTDGVARVCPASQSSKISFLFRTRPDGKQPGSIDPSHKGPCAVYMKFVSSSINNVAMGGGWFKIWSEEYDKTTLQWCTEKLIQNGGRLSVNIPSDLVGGYYLVRPELLSLHEADKSPPNPQFYTGCAQIFLKSKATALPMNTVSIPGHVTVDDQSVRFNIYKPKWPYPSLGPRPYISGSSLSKQIQPVARQTEGILPQNAVLTNANWWGVELDAYSTSTGCWNASTICWNQCTTCYNTAPPTGSFNCKLWESKCTVIQDACNAKNFVGPPNRGKILNPAKPSS